MTHCKNKKNLRDGKQISKNLLSSYDSVILTRRNKILAIHERAAGIILAAGGSTRYQGNKLLIDWKGIPLVRHIVEQALNSTLDSVVVVVGNKAGEIIKALHGLPVQIIKNKQWQLGISSSIKAGIQGLRGNYGCTIIIQADQPFFSAKVIDALLSKHLENFNPVVGLKVHGKRSTPTLFDQTLFHELCNLAGDQGGSQLFVKYPPLLISWNDRRLPLDIDSAQDLAKAQKMRQ
jgi:molybdenum cofactor cytidylyltransferase